MPVNIWYDRTGMHTVPGIYRYDRTGTIYRYKFKYGWGPTAVSVPTASRLLSTDSGVPESPHPDQTQADLYRYRYLPKIAAPNLRPKFFTFLCISTNIHKFNIKR